jgi:hypothetical protein
MSPFVPQPEHAPDLVDPVIGYRQWRVADRGLRSIACDQTWPAPTLAARCGRGDHPHEAPPASACSCGIHAWYDPCPRSASAGTPEYVTGAVALWGAIELHVTGMRAQHCRIIALALPLSHWGKRDRVVDVADRLGIPTVRHRDLRMIASEHGAPVPAGLRPPRRWLAPAGGAIGFIPNRSAPGRLR